MKSEVLRKNKRRQKLRKARDEYISRYVLISESLDERETEK